MADIEAIVQAAPIRVEISGAPGPAPSGTGLVSVTSGVLDVPTTLAARINADAANLRTQMGLGTAAVKDTGTTENTVPLIGAGDKLPASIIPDNHVAATVTGNGISITGQAISLSIGTGATDIAAGDHTHTDLTNATSAATANTLVKRSATGGVSFANSGGMDTQAVSAETTEALSYAINATASDVSSTVINAYNSAGGLAGSFSSNGGVAATFSSGANDEGSIVDFGSSGDDRAFVSRVLGAFGWRRINLAGETYYNGRIQAANNLEADRIWTLPDATGTIALTSDIANIDETQLDASVNASLDLADSALQPPAIIPDADNRTLALTDAGDYVRFSNATSTVLTIPTNASVAFPIGTEVFFRLVTGAGPITLSNAGVTVNNSAAIAGMRAESTFAMIKVGTDEWDLIVGNDGFNTAKATVVDADKVPIFDSAASDDPKYALFSTIWTWIKAKIDAGQTWAGAQAFSSTTRPTSSGTGTPSATSLMTRNDVQSVQRLSPSVQVFPTFIGAHSGTTASNFILSYVGLGHSYLLAGSAAGGWSRCMYSSAFSGFNYGGYGLSFNAKFRVSGSFMAGNYGAHNANGACRLIIGGDGNSLPADQAAFAYKAIGIEIGYHSTTGARARIIYHDGTTYKQSAWITLGGLFSNQNVSYTIENVGNGTINLTMKVSGFKEGPASLVGEPVSVTVSDGPSGGNGQFSSQILWALVNHSSTVIEAFGDFIPTPIILDTTQ